MVIITKPVSVEELKVVETVMFFDDWVKCVADVDKGIIAVNASMHFELGQLLLDHGSSQESLYGFNIWYEPFHR